MVVGRPLDSERIHSRRSRYIVGENAGMHLNEEGGIEFDIAAEQPEGVPDENCLPITREDLELYAQMRMCFPDHRGVRIYKGSAFRCPRN